jgi:enamine deaminase RidA (YjgF/YER057c/UK114 family)
MQAYIMLHGNGSPVMMRRLAFPGAEATSGTVAHTGGYDHVYLSNITGSTDSRSPADFKSQAEGMFLRAEETLRQQRLSYRNVVRAWFYLRDMEEDYAAFNAVRNRLYAKWGIGPLPASTGIQGAVYPTERKCGMDVYALGGCSSYRTKVMHSLTMNEPPEYGSAFSRALRLDRDDTSLVLVSGTASINRQGEILHVGDIEKQVERMLHNVEQLLDGEHLGMDSALSCVTYLKSAELLEAYCRVCARHPLLQNVVNSVVVADVCRPEWLCEMEVVVAAGEFITIPPAP